MPVVLEKGIPSAEELLREGLPISIGAERDLAKKKLKRIAIVNLMPNKSETEKQLLRLLAVSEENVEVIFLSLKTHKSKNISSEYLESYYQSLEAIGEEQLDGMIITGAPLEYVDFEEVTYWQELKQIMDYARDRVPSTIFICWGAIAGLYHYYDIPKSLVDKKVFGVFPHFISKETALFKSLEEPFWVPQSRYFQLDKELLEKVADIEILSESSEAGIYAVASKDHRQLFVTGHLEYEVDTLSKEYYRDMEKGLEIHKPRHYFPQDNPGLKPKNLWRKNASRFFNNWLKYYTGKNIAKGV